MSYIIRFPDTEAPERDDNVVWTQIHIEEAAPDADLSLDASWAAIDALAWTDADASTSEPTPVTTANGTLAAGWYRAYWTDAANGKSLPTSPVYRAADQTSGRFASLADMRARLAIAAWEPADADRCGLLLDLATAEIVAQVGKTDAWAVTLAPVPQVLRAICVEMVARVMANPTGARSQTEQLGSYQHSESYSDSGHTLEMTASERLRARAAVYGATTASARATSLIDDIAE